MYQKKWNRTVKKTNQKFDKDLIIKRLEKFLKSPVPDDLTNKKYSCGTRGKTRKAIDEIFLNSNL